MSRLTSNLVAAALLGQLVGLLGWIDPLFIPLFLLGPVISGAVAAARGISYSWIAALWVSAGICLLWTDWVVNREDVLFHVAVAALMPLLVGIGFGAVRLATRARRPA